MQQPRPSSLSNQLRSQDCSTTAAFVPTIGSPSATPSARVTLTPSWPGVKHVPVSPLPIRSDHERQETRVRVTAKGGRFMAAILTSMSDGTAIIVAGPPAAGKTTLARSLAPRLGFPLLSKDTIKETLFDSLGTGSLEWSQQLGTSAFNIMFALADGMPQVMLEAYFQAKFAVPQLHAMNRPLLQVYCRCPIELAVDRYRKRIVDPHRHPGHLLEHQVESEIEKWASISQDPLQLDGPLIEVDTTHPIDVDALTSDVRNALSGQHRNER